SLPEDMRSEVQDQMDQKTRKQEEVYGRPTSQIKKKGLSDQSNRFGAAFFSSMQSSFMPINEPNVDGNYLLDFGDVLEIQLLGQKANIEELEIKSDGSINLKHVGKIYLAGLPLAKADDLIKAKVSEAYLGTKAIVSLIKIRDMQIYILGEVFNPGLYTLNGNSNILHALNVAGGILDSGTFRNAQVKRQGELIATVDLYEFFVEGNADFNTRLRSGDVVFIPPVQKVNSVYGGVKRAGEYELKETESVLDLINFANGFSPTAQKNEIKYFRYADSFMTTLLYDQLSDTFTEYQDAVFVPDILFKTISINGAVNFPGQYNLKIDATLSDLIKTAGGYRSDAYPLGGILENIATGEVSSMASELAYKKLIENVFENGIEVTGGVTSILNELREKPSKRMIASFDLDLISSNPSLDTIIQNQDRIFIPIKTEQIFVYGGVNSPGTTRFNAESTLEDYINSKGGFSKSANKDLIFIVQPNGESSLHSSKKLRLFGSVDEIIYPGSFIFVTPKMEVSAQQSVSLWAPLVSSFALTAASLASIN
ncbi:MAG: SLBB domain-containing protein, partial [Proteobacteria bacterium]|nr:SLBB domain-containing protein [Pseudomonadota bacterium]